MDSLFEQDPTLPVDFEGSANQDVLEEVTFGPTMGSHYRYSDGSVPMVEKTSSGRLSPIRARTMKEYEQQISDLKKENFNLKLRIYFLEERMQQKYGDGEDVFKTNIELKVEVESAKKELMEKHELLKSASNAMETMASQHQTELEYARGHQAHELQTQIDSLARQLQETRADAKNAKDLLNNAKERIEELVAVNIELESRSHNGKSNKETQEHVKATIGEKDRIIEQLNFALKTKDELLTQLDDEKVAALEKQKVAFEEKMKSLQSTVKRRDHEIQILEESLEKDHTPTSTAMQNYKDFQSLEHKIDRSTAVGDEASETARSLQDLVEDQQLKLNELEIVAGEYSEEARKKDDMIRHLEDILREKDKDVKDLSNRTMQLEKDLKTHEGGQLKRDKAIQGLTSIVGKKDKEIQKLQKKLEEKDECVNDLKEELHNVNMSNIEGSMEQNVKVSDSESKVADLQSQLRLQVLENQRFKKAIEKSQRELEELHRNFEKANEMCEEKTQDALDLRDKLQKEKENNFEKLESQDQQYQGLLDDTQRQLQSKELLLQRLTNSLQSKDKQIEQLMILHDSAQPSNLGKDSVIKGLQERIKERDQAVEDAIDEKFSSLEEKDREIRGIKITLRERERDLERANQMLLSAEETIDALEKESTEKDQNMKQLANSLRANHKTLEDTQDNHSRVLEEKEGMIRKLQRQLSKKDKDIQNALDQSSLTDTSDVIRTMQEKLKEKERLLEDLMRERSKTTLENERATQELLAKLRQKDFEIRDLCEQHNKETAVLNKDLQQLQADSNKKDYELQRLENENSWAQEQQQEMLDKISSALKEKDNTIQALIESGTQKDKLIGQMQSPDRKLTASVAQLQKLRDTVARLENELQDKNDEIASLQSKFSFQRKPMDSQDRGQEMDSNMVLEEILQAKQDLQKQLGHLKQHMAEHGVNPQAVLQLRQELVQLREQLERPGTPQRVNTLVGGEDNLHQVLQDQLSEVDNLQQALLTEINVYRNLTSPGSIPSETSHSLTMIEHLRTQLQEGVERNNQLGQTLEKKLSESSSATGTHTPVTPEMKDELFSLRNQLEESKRWNMSLQSRLDQQQRGGGVGQSKETAMSMLSPRSESSDISSDAISTSDDTSKREVDRMRQEMNRLKSKLNQKRTQIKNQQTQLERLEEQRSIPGENNSDRNIEHQKLSAKIEQLQLQLQESYRLNESLKQQLDAVSRGNVDSAPLRQQLEFTQQELLRTQENNAQLKEQVKTLRSDIEQNENNTDSVAYLQNQVKTLQKNVIQAEHQSTLLQRQIQLQESSEGFNPDLIVQMAREMELLKEENEVLKQGRVEAPPSPTSSRNRPPSGMASHRSQIPTYKGTDVSNNTLRGQLLELKREKKKLQNKLASTEETVRSQTEKMKYYRGLLEDAGLINRTPQRSSSDTNLSRLNSSSPFKHKITSASTENLRRDVYTPLAHHISLNAFDEFGQSDNAAELKEQIKQLRDQLERYQRIIRSLQSRVRLGSSETSSSDRLGSPRQRSPGLQSRIPISVQRSLSQENVLKTQDVIEKLRKDKEALQIQLADSEHDNKRIQEGLRRASLGTDGHDYAEKLKKQQDEISSLRKQLKDSLNASENLKSRLLEVNNFLDELLHQDEFGEVDMIDMTSERVTELKDKVNETINLANTLTDGLGVMEDHNDGEISESMSTVVPSSNFHETLVAQSQQRIEALERENEKLKASLGNKHEQDKFKSTLRASTTDSATEVDRLKRDIENRNQTISQLCTKLKELEAEVNQYRSEPARHHSPGDGGESSVMSDSSSSMNGSADSMREKRRPVHGKQTDTKKIGSVNQSMDFPPKTSSARNGSVQSGEKHRKDRSGRRTKDNKSNADMDSDLSNHSGDVSRDSKGKYKPTLQMSDYFEECFEPHTSQHDNSIERQRHMTANSDHPALYRSVEGSIDYNSEYSTTSSNRHPSGPTRQHRYPSGPSSHSDESRSRYHSGPTRPHAQRNGNMDDPFSYSTSTANYFGSRHDVIVDNRERVVNQGRLHYIPEFDDDVTSDNANDRIKKNSTGVANKNEMLSMKEKLKTSEELNATLHEEIRILDSIRQSSIAVGIQSSPTVGTHASQTSDQTDSQPTGSNNQVILQQHLNEIRALRKRLEESVTNTDRLREQLEEKLRNTQQDEDTSPTTNIYLRSQGQTGQHPSEKELSALWARVQELERLNSDLEAQLKDQEHISEAKETILEQKDNVIKDLKKSNKDKDNYNKSLKADLSTAKDESRKILRESERTRREASSLKEQLNEEIELNKTLRLELRVYEKLKNQSQGMKGSGDLDLSALFEEMAQLRLQLERTIQTNNALRAKLEERLTSDRVPSSKGSTVNIHHIYPDLNGDPHTKEVSDSHSPERDTSNSSRDRQYNRHSRHTSGLNNSVEQPRSAGTSFQSRHHPHIQSPTTKSRHSVVRTRSSSGGSLHLNDDISQTQDTIHISPDVPVSHRSPKGPRVYSYRSPGGTVHKNRSYQSDSSPGKYLDNSMMYYIDDPPVLHGTSPVRVDSDLRVLYAIGKLDDYELLKKEISECLVILSGMEARVQDRLSAFRNTSPSQSIEYSTMKELNSASYNLRICLVRGSQLLSLFWISQLPNRDEEGRFVDIKLALENKSLQEDLSTIKHKYASLQDVLAACQHKLKLSNKVKLQEKLNYEAAIKAQVQKTINVLDSANSNLREAEDRWNARY